MEPEIDENEILQTAERVYIKIADQMRDLDQQCTIKTLFKDQIQQVSHDHKQIELLTIPDFLEGVRELGIGDLSQRDITCMLKMITKEKVQGNIRVAELVQIMENFGIYENEASGQPQTQDTDEYSLNGGSQPSASKPQGADQFDLSRLDKKSRDIMEQLMIRLIETEQTAQEFFID